MNQTILAIPYRNRKIHLDYFLANTLPLLVKHIPAVHVVIVEQSEDNRLFNRGKLLNVAFQEYRTSAQYFITQDVDTNPLESSIINYYCKEVGENAVMGIYNAECNTLGGIIKMRGDTMVACNGFPNEFWGWGSEDKALQNRCEFYDMTITKNILTNDPAVATHFTIFNDIQDRCVPSDATQKTQREYFMFRHLDTEAKQLAIENSGLKTLTYSILSRSEISDHVTHLVVEL